MVGKLNGTGVAASGAPALPGFRHNSPAGDTYLPRVIHLRRFAPYGLLAVAITVLALVGVLPPSTPPARAQACPPYCATPVITPAWHLHMCDEPYQEQQDDNHCMRGKGVTEFPAATDRVYIIYCHKYSDTVMVFVKDSGGGLQFINHPDGVTYSGEGCETLIFAHANGIPPGGSPYFTSASWPEGPFSGAGAGIEWYIGGYIAFDQDDYYGNDAQAFITARDPGAEPAPGQRRTIEVRVSSTSDPTGIPLTLREQAAGFSIFKSEQPLRFSQLASNAAQGVIKVRNRDVITVSFCPRNCTTPYSDTATWYQLAVTVTPTPLPTWAGPPPTETATPPPDLPVRYLTLRPAPADVGYVPQIGTNKDRANHLGYPTIYAGMWTRGRNIHHGMVQFDLSELPEDARAIEARLEMVGRESTYTKPGTWSVALLDGAIDAGWRQATYDQVHGTQVLAQLEPVLADYDVGVGRRNGFGLTGAALDALNQRLATTRRISFRVDGPGGEDNNLFAWESGVDTYNRAPDPPDPALGPSLHLAYGVLPEPTPETPGATPASATPIGPLATATASATASATPTGPLGATATSTVTPPPASTTLTPVTPSTPPPTTSTAPTPSPMATPSTTSTAPIATSATPSPTDTAPAGTAPTTPPPARTATTAPTATPFGPATGRQVCVLAYDDRDGDSQRGPDERFLAGVTLRLTHTRSGVFDSWTTDGANDPDYCWNGLVDGPYTLRAVGLPRGYVASGPQEYRLDVPYAGSPPHYAFGARRPELPTATRAPSATIASTHTPAPTPTRTPTPEPTISGPSGEICLEVFEDRDRDHAPGEDEPRLAGPRLRIADQNHAVVRELVARSDGPVCARLATGVYYAGVVAGSAGLPGLVPTTALEEAVLLTEGVRRGVAFGWYRPGPGERAWLPRVLREGPRPRSGRPTLWWSAGWLTPRSMDHDRRYGRYGAAQAWRISPEILTNPARIGYTPPASPQGGADSELCEL